jgi:hypothetical protein
MTLTDIIGLWLAASAFVAILWSWIKPTRHEKKKHMGQGKVVGIDTYRRKYDSAS